MTEQLQEYISSESAIAISSTTPLDLNVEETLKSIANTGWITCDSGTVYVQINGKAKIKIELVSGDTLEFSKDENWIIRKVLITGTGTIRYLFKKGVVITLGLETQS